MCFLRRVFYKFSAEYIGISRVTRYCYVDLLVTTKPHVQNSERTTPRFFQTTKKCEIKTKVAIVGDNASRSISRPSR